MEGRAARRTWAGTFSLHAASGGPQGGRGEAEGRTEEAEARTLSVWQARPAKKDQKDCCGIEKKRLRRDLVTAFTYVKGC